jgi:hypothetical protein
MAHFNNTGTPLLVSMLFRAVFVNPSSVILPIQHYVALFYLLLFFWTTFIPRATHVAMQALSGTQGLARLPVSTRRSANGKRSFR